MPLNIVLTPYLRVEAAAGLKINVKTDNYGRGNNSANVRAEYMTRAGIQEFEALAYMNGEEVHYDIPAGVRIIDLKYRQTGYDTEFPGSFECSDFFYDTLWLKARNTVNVNMRDGIQDPDRERAQWWGDAVNVLGQIFYCCDTRAYALIRKAMLNLVHWQRPDGVLYSPIPAGSWDKELPCQMLAAIGTYGFWTYYKYSGDEATIRHVYPHVRDYVRLWNLDSDGLVVHRLGDWNWADWGSNLDYVLLENAWFYMALDAAGKMAELCEEFEDMQDCQASMMVLKQSFNRNFWTGKEYRSLSYTLETDDRGNALAVVSGIADSSKWTAIRTVLGNQRNASPYMEKYVLEAFFVMGDPRGALTRMKKRYGTMVSSEISTLWEHWYKAAGSHNHGWAGGPLTLLSQYVAGVAPVEPGYDTYHVFPQMGDLEWVRIGVPSVHGMIRVDLKQEENIFRLTLHSPTHSTAIVGIPKESGKITEYINVNGQLIWSLDSGSRSLDSVIFLDEDESFFRFKTPPGLWEFTAGYTLWGRPSP